MKLKKMVAGAAIALMMAGTVVGGIASPANAATTYTKTYYASGSTPGGGLMCGFLLGQAAAELKKRGYVVTSSSCDSANRKITVHYTEASNT